MDLILMIYKNILIDVIILWSIRFIYVFAWYYTRITETKIYVWSDLKNSINIQRFWESMLSYIDSPYILHSRYLYDLTWFF